MKFISVFLLALCTAVASAAQELHTPDEINAFFEDTTPRKVPFELTGKVLSTFRSPRTVETVLADASGARVELYRALDLPQPAPGDTITARGFASVGQNYEPYVLLENFDILEHGPSPAPVPVRLAETNAKEHHLLTIRKTLNQIEGDASITVNFDVPRRHFQDTTAHLLRQIKEDNAQGQLTERQLDILAAVAQGQSNSDIAKRLGLSEITIKKHLSAIFERLGVANRAEAVALALRKQLLKA